MSDQEQTQTTDSIRNVLTMADAQHMMAWNNRMLAALEQAQACLLGETPEVGTPEEARADTLNVIREAMRPEPPSKENQMNYGSDGDGGW